MLLWASTGISAWAMLPAPLTCSNQEEATRQSERQRASGLVSWPNEQMFLFNRNSLWDQMARVDRLNGRPKERREQRVSVVGSHLSTAGRQMERIAPATRMDRGKRQSRSYPSSRSTRLDRPKPPPVINTALKARFLFAFLLAGNTQSG